MTTRRDFVKTLTVCGSLLAIPVSLPTDVLAQEKLPRRKIPGTDETLPIIGLGTSNFFRQNDVPASMALIELFHERGGAYIDCMGTTRFVVAEVANKLDIGRELFLGNYFMNEEEGIMRENIQRLLEATGKEQLDLVQTYPEFAVPNWKIFEKWKDEGLTKYIGIARHRSSYYESMMNLMETGTVDFLQVNYSPLETQADQRVLPMAMDKGVAVNINRPFMNGEYFSHVRGQSLPDWAAEFDCESWAQFSLKFILSNPAVNCVLTETANLDHAVDNIEAGFGRMPDQRTRQRIVEHLQSL